MYCIFLFAPGHYCAGGIALPCPAGTYGPKEGLQRLKECTICPAGRVLIVANLLIVANFLNCSTLFYIQRLKYVQEYQ